MGEHLGLFVGCASKAIVAFKARWGQLYNNKLAFRYRKAPNPLCPACKTDTDSVGHLLGGCQEPSCKAMAIQLPGG